MSIKSVGRQATSTVNLSAKLQQILAFAGLGYRMFKADGTAPAPWSGRRTHAKISNGKRRGVRYPCSMHRQDFATSAERNERFRQLRATATARDVTRGYDVDKWYVAWNGKAA